MPPKRSLPRPPSPPCKRRARPPSSRPLTLPPSPSSSPPPQTYLDLLPPELLLHICHILSHARPSPSLLHLALSTPAQLAPALASLSHELVLSGDALLDLPHWLSLLGPSIQRLSVGHVAVFPLPLRARVLALLRAPTLCHLTMTDDLHALRALQGSAVRSLNLRLTSPSAHFALLLRALRTLRLRELHLCSNTRFASECPFDAANPSPLLQALPPACPHLVALCLSCALSQHTHARYTDPVWPLLPRLPHLRQLTLHSDAPATALPLLRRLDDVRVKSRLLWACDRPDAPSLAAFALAKLLAHRVTHLTTQEILTAAQLRGLRACRNIAALDIHVRASDDAALVDAVRALPALTRLAVRWADNRAAESTSMFAIGPSTAYAACGDGVLEGLARHARNLEELSLLNVSIELPQLDVLLRARGPCLKHFDVAIVGQREKPFVRLHAVLARLARYGAALRSWPVDVSALVRAYPMSEWYDGTVSAHKDGLQKAVHRLQRAAPLLDTANFERQIADIFGDGAVPGPTQEAVTWRGRVFA